MTSIIREWRRWWRIRKRRLMRLMPWRLYREVRNDILFGCDWTPVRSDGGMPFYKCNLCTRVSLRPTGGMYAPCPQKLKEFAEDNER